MSIVMKKRCVICDKVISYKYNYCYTCQQEKGEEE